MNKIFVKAAVLSGVIAGAVFLVLEMIMVPMFLGGSPWGPPRMIGAIAMGRAVLPTPGQAVIPDFSVLMVAMFVHFILSVIYLFIIGLVCRRMDMGPALAVGAVAGLVLYFINFYVFTGVWPWFEMARNWVTIFSHIAFGVVAAYAFKKIYRVVPAYT